MIQFFSKCSVTQVTKYDDKYENKIYYIYPIPIVICFLMFVVKYFTKTLFILSVLFLLIIHITVCTLLIIYTDYNRYYLNNSLISKPNTNNSIKAKSITNSKKLNIAPNIVDVYDEFLIQLQQQEYLQFLLGANDNIQSLFNKYNNSFNNIKGFENLLDFVIYKNNSIFLNDTHILNNFEIIETNNRNLNKILNEWLPKNNIFTQMEFLNFGILFLNLLKETPMDLFSENIFEKSQNTLNLEQVFKNVDVINSIDLVKFFKSNNIEINNNIKDILKVYFDNIYDFQFTCDALWKNLSLIADIPLNNNGKYNESICLSTLQSLYLKLWKGVDLLSGYKELFTLYMKDKELNDEIKGYVKIILGTDNINTIKDKFNELFGKSISWDIFKNELIKYNQKIKENQIYVDDILKLFQLNSIDELFFIINGLQEELKKLNLDINNSVEIDGYFSDLKDNKYIMLLNNIKNNFTTPEECFNLLKFLINLEKKTDINYENLITELKKNIDTIKDLKLSLAEIFSIEINDENMIIYLKAFLLLLSKNNLSLKSNDLLNGLIILQNNNFEKERFLKIGSILNITNASDIFFKVVQIYNILKENNITNSVDGINMFLLMSMEQKKEANRLMGLITSQKSKENFIKALNMLSNDDIKNIDKYFNLLEKINNNIIEFQNINSILANLNKDLKEIKEVFKFLETFNDKWYLLFTQEFDDKNIIIHKLKEILLNSKFNKYADILFILQTFQNINWDPLTVKEFINMEILSPEEISNLKKIFNGLVSFNIGVTQREDFLKDIGIDISKFNDIFNNLYINIFGNDFTTNFDSLLSEVDSNLIKDIQNIGIEIDKKFLENLIYQMNQPKNNIILSELLTKINTYNVISSKIYASNLVNLFYGANNDIILRNITTALRNIKSLFMENSEIKNFDDFITYISIIKNLNNFVLDNVNGKPVTIHDFAKDSKWNNDFDLFKVTNDFVKKFITAYTFILNEDKLIGGGYHWVDILDYHPNLMKIKQFYIDFQNLYIDNNHMGNINSQFINNNDSTKMRELLVSHSILFRLLNFINQIPKLKNKIYVNILYKLHNKILISTSDFDYINNKIFKAFHLNRLLMCLDLISKSIGLVIDNSTSVNSYGNIYKFLAGIVYLNNSYKMIFNGINDLIIVSDSSVYSSLGNINTTNINMNNISLNYDGSIYFESSNNKNSYINLNGFNNVNLNFNFNNDIFSIIGQGIDSKCLSDVCIVCLYSAPLAKLKYIKYKQKIDYNISGFLTIDDFNKDTPNYNLKIIGAEKIYISTYYDTKNNNIIFVKLPGVNNFVSLLIEIEKQKDPINLNKIIELAKAGKKTFVIGDLV